MLSPTTKTNLKQLYETDDHRWLAETIKLLKANRLNELDVEHLIDELESLGKRDKSKAESLLEQIIRYLLYLQYWQTEIRDNSSHWEAEIDSLRTQLRRHLTTNLYQHLEQEFDIIYQDAWRYVSKKTKLTDLPTHCPYTLAQLLDLNWLP
ncbi:MAG: DUF29 domain-containing protein [Microcystaceae cyanobacterium]